ncbi:hypothetical protein [Dactylosporangium sp. CA-233914]|uniref:hypothetical protein n=1 Tax=Dactylosporangium sp. CA-233914 TaxID=3239934 RepID=UPI003D913C97
MSDFDEVLELLLSDPGFKARLAADPAGTLAGYRLTPDELDILQSQLGDAGGQTHVEQRTSKASMFGVFSSIGSGLGDVLHGHGHGVSAHGLPGADMGHRLHDVVEQQYGGRHAALEPAGAGDGPPGASGFEEVHTSSHQESYSEYHSEVHTSGTVYHSSTYAGVTGGTPSPAPGGAHGLGAALSGISDQMDSSGAAQDQGTAGLGASGGGLGAGLAGLAEQAGSHGSAGPGASAGGVGAGLAGLAEQAGSHGSAGLGASGGGVGAGLAGLAEHAGHAQVPGAAPTDGYHTRVDWDGDGRWDQHTYVNRADGGVDIVVDKDGDGRAEFIGHDTNRDGLIDSSEIDFNHDGVMDARYEDVNGDGWLDRRTR